MSPPSRSSRPAVLAAVAFLVLAAALGGLCAVSDDADAAVSTGSESSPRSSVSGCVYTNASTNYLGQTVYVSVGASVSLTSYYSDDRIHEIVSVSSDVGLSVSSGTLSGTVDSDYGTVCVVTVESETEEDGQWTDHVYIWVVEDPNWSTGSYSSPLSSLSSELHYSTSKTYVGKTVYVANGAYVNLTEYTADALYYGVSSVDSGYGLSLGDTLSTRYDLSGYVSGSDGDVVTVTISAESEEDGEWTAYLYLCIVADASYVPTHTYTLTYKDSYGGGAPEAESATLVTVLTSYSFTVSGIGADRNGYDFAGWSTSNPGSSGDEDDVDYLEGDTITLSASSPDEVLYAVWIEGDYVWTAQIVYDTGCDYEIASQSASYTSTSSEANGSYTFYISSVVPTRDCYTFVGWSTVSSTETSGLYSPGDTLTVAYGSSVTLYAVWSQIAVSVTGDPDSAVVVGSTWSYAPSVSVEGSSVSGYTVAVSGISATLSSDGSTLYWTPTTSGTYTVTVTVSYGGYAAGTQEFTVTVYPVLSFSSSPSLAVIAYAL